MLRIEATLVRKRQHLSERLERGRSQDIADELDEVRIGGIDTDVEAPLSEQAEDRPAALDMVGGAGCENEQLPRPCGIRIAEHGRGHVALATQDMLTGNSDAALVLMVLVDR